jgi:hypothetical protein
MNFFQLMKLLNVETSEMRLLRHTNREIDVLSTFNENLPKFEAYQGFQKEKAFGKAKNIAAFSALPNNEALFLGVWNIVQYFPVNTLLESHKDLLQEHDLPAEWENQNAYYETKLEVLTNHLSQRVIISWGRSAISWLQRADKAVLEVRREMSREPFTSYNNLHLAFTDLVQIVNNQISNKSWVDALSSVNGIYLINDNSTGKLYVGSACGARGIFQRWSEYVATGGHGGNQALLGLDPRYLTYSILEVLHPTLGQTDVVRIENQWKARLGTRKNGHLNSPEIQ